MDRIIDVWDGDAILMAQALCRKLGSPVGISSGANVVGAMQLVEDLGPEATVVTVLPDSNKKYLSTDLCLKESARDTYLTPNHRTRSLSRGAIACGDRGAPLHTKHPIQIGTGNAVPMLAIRASGG